MSKKNIVFICHEASRTGAPILLLRLVKELCRIPDYSIQMLLMNPGTLYDDFKKVVPVHFLNYTSFGRVSLKDRILLKFGLRQATSNYRHRRLISDLIEAADIIFGNTVLSARALEGLNLINKRVFFFIHELNFAVKSLVTPVEMKKIEMIAEKVFVPAEFVGRFLVNDYQFDGSKIQILKYIKPEPPVYDNRLVERDKRFRVGCCGNLEMRKGADIFLLVVSDLVRKRNITDIDFYWVGANENSQNFFLFQEDVKKCGLLGFINVIKSVPNPLDYIKEFDIFLLPSREDPYPVVVIEAASIGIPTIFFQDAGGIGEFLGNGGISIEYLNISLMSDQILALRDDPEQLQELKENVLISFNKEPGTADILNQLQLAFQ